MKIKFLTILLIYVSFLNAQNEQSKHSLETQFNLFSSNTISPSLKYRYFINENTALRTRVNIDYQNATQTILQANGDGVGNVQRINSISNFSLGYEYHFANEKFSPYVGIELEIGTGRNDVFGQRTDSVTFVSSLNYQSKQKIAQLGFGIFTGVDVTLYKGLFIGTEIGFSFINTRYKQGEFRTDDSASLTAGSTTTKIPEYKISKLSLVNMGVLRVGWKF